MPDPHSSPVPPSTDPQQADLAAVVTRLRAAGCVFAEDEAALLISAAADAAELDVMVARRAAGYPLEQIVGWAEFCGLRIVVEPGVFVPRRRSEFIVSQALAVAAARQEPAAPITVAELCCGSGAIGIAVATALPHVDLHAADIDPAAVRCARANLAQAGGKVHGHIYEGDLDEPLPPSLRGAVDLLIANAPYVPSADIPLLPAEARLHEPMTALDGGADGVAVQRRVALAAPRWLAPGGHLMIETSDRQAGLTAAAVAAAGLIPAVVTSDELAATVVIGAREGRTASGSRPR